MCKFLITKDLMNLNKIKYKNKSKKKIYYKKNNLMQH